MRSIQKLVRATATIAVLAVTLPPNIRHEARAQPAEAADKEDIGEIDPNVQLSVSVQLTRSYDAEFRTRVDALYNPSSPQFRHWLDDDAIRRYAPAPSAVAAVRGELGRNGLAIVSADPNGFWLRVKGSADAMQRAFRTQLHVAGYGGRMRRTATVAPSLGEATPFLAAVVGLETRGRVFEPVVRPAISRAPLGYAPVLPLKTVKASPGGLSDYITPEILRPTVNLNVTGTSYSGAPRSATFSGLVYGPTPYKYPDFVPAQVRRFYGLEEAYQKGLDGAGQTLVQIVYGLLPTVASDAKAFNALFGLPSFKPGQFTTVYSAGTPPVSSGTLADMYAEWAHAMAPGAKLIQVAMDGDEVEDVLNAMQYVVSNNTGHVVQEDFIVDFDEFAGPAEQLAFENVLIVAAAKGISFNCASGDVGDEGPSIESDNFNPSQINTPLGAPSLPSVAPHATAVGGTSIVNVAGLHEYIPLGFGDNFNILDSSDIIPLPPGLSPYGPLQTFVFGSTGGESLYWPKPSWQASLPGVGRQVPDISALGNYFTGVPVVSTDTHSNQSALVVGTGYGGTSLSSTIFSAIWSLAAEQAGQPLGQAAPTISLLKAGIVDVEPYPAPHRLTATITSGNETKTYGQAAIFLGLHPANDDHFLSGLVLYPDVEGPGLADTLDLDTSLVVGKGWDNVTGWGTPYGLAFIKGAAEIGKKLR